jgi:hypothetical protein
MNSLTQKPGKIEKAVFARDLHLDVRGVGRIRFPIGLSITKCLCAVARRARHGFKDETRLDPRVRGTREIAKRRNSIDHSRWTNIFAPHHDSEKTDSMVGTLVVSLPPRFTGGDANSAPLEQNLL